MVDDVLRQGVQGISDLITVPGLINLDFADVRAVMRSAGSALMGIGRASGTDRAECDCIHAPAVPEAVTVGTPTLSGDESSALPGSDTSVTIASPFGGAHDPDHAHRFTGEPPPLYLMECAFLI